MYRFPYAHPFKTGDKVRVTETNSLFAGEAGVINSIGQGLHPIQVVFDPNTDEFAWLSPNQIRIATPDSSSS